MATPPHAPQAQHHATGILRGAMIACEDGDIAIESVKIGDIVNTLSDGPQVVRWVGGTPHETNLIQFQAGAMGNNLPKQTLRVAPNQRMVLAEWQAEVLFGESRLLVAAEALVNGESIRLIKPQSGAECFHILFDKHEAIAANGTETESFYPSNLALSQLGPEVRAALAPELATQDPNHPFDPVYPEISAAEVALIR